MIKPIKDTYLDLFQFFKKPVDHSNSNQTLKEKVTKLFLILILDIGIAGICILLISALESFGLYSMENHKTVEMLKTLPKSAVIFSFIITVPLLEEIIFRMYLRYKTNYLLRFFLLLFYVAGKENKECIEKRIKKIWYKQYVYIFYFSAVIFGFVHVYNFDFDYKILLLFPIITAPQIFLGIFAGYLRVRFNLIWGYFLHAIHNMIFLLPFLLMSGSSEKLNVTNNNFQLIIEEITHSNLDSESYIYSSDSLFIEDIKMKELVAQLLDKDEKLIEFSSNEQAKQRINLQFRKYSDSIQSKKTILEEMQDVYKFKITKSDLSHKIWALQIADTALLYKYKKIFKNSSKINISDKEIKMENVRLSQLAKKLNSNYEQFIISNIDSNDKFNFEIRKMTFSKLQELLKNKYGLCLEMNEMKIESVKVDFYDM